MNQGYELWELLTLSTFCFQRYPRLLFCAFRISTVPSMSTLRPLCFCRWSPHKHFFCRATKIIFVLGSWNIVCIWGANSCTWPFLAHWYFSPVFKKGLPQGQGLSSHCFQAVDRWLHCASGQDQDLCKTCCLPEHGGYLCPSNSEVNPRQVDRCSTGTCRHRLGCTDLAIKLADFGEKRQVPWEGWIFSSLSTFVASWYMPQSNSELYC